MQESAGKSLVSALLAQGTPTHPVLMHTHISFQPSPGSRIMLLAGLIWVGQSLGSGARSKHSRVLLGDYSPGEPLDPSAAEAAQWEESMLYYQGLGYAPARAL